MDVKNLASPKQCSSEVELNEFILGSEVLYQERYERIRGFRRPHHYTKFLLPDANVPFAGRHSKSCHRQCAASLTAYHCTKMMVSTAPNLDGSIISYRTP